MGKHRCFEVTTPEGTMIRINGDPNMDQRTLDALMALADAAMQQFSRPLAPTEFRKDGWPLCPVCGEDELWSPLIWEEEPPALEAFIAAGLSCYKCGWSKEPSEKERRPDQPHNRPAARAGRHPRRLRTDAANRAGPDRGQLERYVWGRGPARHGAG